ncbi:MAG: YcnI family protein [Parvibaculaceae bacterium]|nr:YcnI family protein [Parvibaculaceae bacterium]
MSMTTLARAGACALAGCIALSAPAFAHITAQPNQAMWGHYFQTSFSVPHGCDGAATTSIKISIPEGLVSVKPQMKPGWKIKLTMRKLETPVKGDGGRMITETVSEVEWKGGPLPDAYYDTFGLVMKLPPMPDHDMAGMDKGMPVYFPVVQTCQTGMNKWVNIPAAGQAWHDVKDPAPYVNVLPDQDGGMGDMGNMKH